MSTRVALAVVLVLSLVFAQTFGLLHRIVDSPAARHAGHSHADADHGGSTSEAGHFVAALVPTHDDPGHCEAFDQLSLGSALTGEAGAALDTAVLSSAGPALPTVQLAADEPRHDFQARAPPGAGIG